MPIETYSRGKFYVYNVTVVQFSQNAPAIAHTTLLNSHLGRLMNNLLFCAFGTCAPMLTFDVLLIIKYTVLCQLMRAQKSTGRYGLYGG